MNEYLKEFSLEMSSVEAKLKFFTMAKQINENEFGKLHEAYESISREILDREIKEASENGTLD